MADESGKNLDDLTVSELRERASSLEITGRSSMNKEELRQAVEDAEAQTAFMSSDEASESSSSDSSSEAESDEASSDTSSEDRPWRETDSSSSEEDISHITAPSIGPNTTVDLRPPSERLDMDKISDVDAMGLDKRRQVRGRRYGASPAKQLAVYGGAVAVIVALVIGGKLLTDELDKAPPEGEVEPAPWATAEQRPAAPIDFPCAITGSNNEVQCGPKDDASP